MSLPDKSGKAAARFLRLAVLSGLAAGMVVAAGCTVRPLYSNAPLSPGGDAGTQAELASIAVKPVSTRYAQQVRNHLIFALNGGAERTAAPVYSLDLAVTESVEASAVVQVTTDQDQPTAGTVTLNASYVLSDAKTGRQLAGGRRSITSAFDRPSQEFATMRAQIDAENRAPRELADLLRLAIAADLARAKAK